MRRTRTPFVVSALLSVIGCGGSENPEGHRSPETQSTRQALIAGLTPLVSCVVPTFLGNETKTSWQPGFQAWFGYQHTGAPASVPVGPENRFSPAPEDRGQPTSFLTDKIRYVFSVPFSSAPLQWTLNGITRTAQPVAGDCTATAPVTIASGMPIVVFRDAVPEVSAAAELLADYLHRITGHDFPVTESPRPGGISLGITGDYLGFEWPYTARVFEPEFRFGKQDYVIATRGASSPVVSIAGATVEALQMAVWEFLHQLGYRQYFPGATWEVVPNRPVIADLHLAIHRRPAFLQRELEPRAGWNFEDDDPERILTTGARAWFERNQLVVRPDAKPLAGRVAWNAGQTAYGRIIHSWQDRHGLPFPSELRGPIGTTGLCLPGEVNVPGVGPVTAESAAREDAAAVFAADPDRDFLTMEPQEAAWGACPDESLSLSDRVVAIANAVARDYQGADPNDDKLMGILAFSHHRDAPTAHSVERNVRVEIACSTPTDFEKLAPAWTARGTALLAARDGGADDNNFVRAGIPLADKVVDRISRFHAAGARFYRLADNISNRWGAVGLAHWAAARTLLTGTPLRGAAAADDFAERAFGAAAGPVRDYFAAMAAWELPQSVSVGRMYRSLEQALLLAPSGSVVRERVRQLALYPRYLELLREFRCPSGGTTPGDVVRRLIGLAYATRLTGMLDSHAIYADEEFAPYIPPEAAVECPRTGSGCAASNPWKDDPLPELGPPTLPDFQDRLDAHLESLITTGAQSHPELFDPNDVKLEFHATTALVPANVPGPPDLIAHTHPLFGTRVRHRHAGLWYTWRDAAGSIAFSLLPQAQSVAARVFGRSSANDPFALVGQDDVLLAEGEVDLVFPSPYSGLHRLDLTPFTADERYFVDWDTGRRFVTIAGAPTERSTHLFDEPLLFYVPRGTSIVGGVLIAGGAPGDGATIRAWRRDATGTWIAQTPYAIEHCAEHFAIPVTDNDQGQLWAFQNVVYQERRPVLLTVPPQLARWPDEFLLPSSVVAADGLAP